MKQITKLFLAKNNLQIEDGLLFLENNSVTLEDVPEVDVIFSRWSE